MTPESNALNLAQSAFEAVCNERDEALVKLSTVNRWVEKNLSGGFIDSLTHLQNLECVADDWYGRLVETIRERDEAREQLNRTLDELYEEQQNHGITKGHLTECRMKANDWWDSYSHVKNENKAMREAIREGHDALTECVDDSGELLAERGWWQDEPRCDYQIRYDEHKQRIEAAKAALTKLQPFLP